MNSATVYCNLMEDNNHDRVVEDVHDKVPACLLGEKWWPENREREEEKEEEEGGDCMMKNAPFEEPIIRNLDTKLTEEEKNLEMIADRHQWVIEHGHTCAFLFTKKEECSESEAQSGFHWCKQDVCVNEVKKVEKKMDLLMLEFERLEVNQFFVSSEIRHDMTEASEEFILASHEHT